MYRLPPIVILLLTVWASYAQNPHGESFKVDCALCHDPSGWEIAIDTFTFDHDTTAFPLSGVHQEVDCKSCHTDFVFKGTSTECIDCHLDIHQMSVGNQCARCHDSNSWLVFNTQEIHEQNGFPLVGGHQEINCVDCHISETNLRFEPLGNDCVSCHMDDFRNTMDPDHEERDFSLNCTDCHDVMGFDWSSDNINHDFFPLTLGHDIQDCKACHLTDDFSDTSPECISCHQADYDQATNPNHSILDFNTDCVACHTIDPGWKPAEFREHDALFFPIYSGEHQGEWDACMDCHLDPEDYSVFSCIVCHTNPDTDDEHDGVFGYVYESNACLACHPDGSEDSNFDHDKTDFPLTGAHIGLDCLECHADGFSGTPTDCASCHTEDFNSATNPNHNNLGLIMDCVSCHTTDPEWMPATFDIHDEFYVLNGAHAMIANDCAACHNGDYNNTPNTCIGCHQADYNNADDPDHNAAMFPTDCLECHTEDAWEPATFNHDEQYFPIYSGSHQGEWSECVDCHINPNDYSVFSCITCHINPETDDEHEGVSGYIYEDNACLVCHPTGDADMAFDHNANTNFPLTGAHIGLDCLECHADGYEGTPMDCAACHSEDFNGSMNPNHNSLGLSMDCVSCHTTDPEWMPASFDVHDQYYALNGAHAMIASDCASCHNGDYNNTPNTCVGCHQADYDGATDPDHSAAMFPTDCLECHTEDAWEPATFDHDDTNFPLTGSHVGLDCLSCHSDGYEGTPTDCAACHTDDFNQSSNPDHNDLGLSMDCVSCHTTDPEWMPASFDVHDQYYQLNGAHAMIANECATCHNGDYNNTPNTCIGCHQADFNEPDNPEHNDANFTTDCIECHTEDAWLPAEFDHGFYSINSAHQALDCNSCHVPAGYDNTPNTCIGCHQSDYDNTINPDHEAAMFPTDCLNCHNEIDWADADWDHDGMYFPIYSGKHEGEWNLCVDCHLDVNDFSSFSCIDCHEHDDQNQVDEDHEGVSGYVYESNACLSCHPTGED